MSSDQTSLSAKKEALSRETEMYKHAIEEQVNVLKESAGQVSKKLLVIGAGVLVSYFIARAVFKKNKNKELAYDRLLPAHTASYPDVSPQVVAAPAVRSENSLANLIKQQIAIFLIGIATQKLQQLLEGARKDNTESSQKNDTKPTEPIYIH